MIRCHENRHIQIPLNNTFYFIEYGRVRFFPCAGFVRGCHNCCRFDPGTWNIYAGFDDNIVYKPFHHNSYYIVSIRAKRVQIGHFKYSDKIIVGDAQVNVIGKEYVEIIAANIRTVEPDIEIPAHI